MRSFLKKRNVDYVWNFQIILKDAKHVQLFSDKDNRGNSQNTSIIIDTEDGEVSYDFN